MGNKNQRKDGKKDKRGPDENKHRCGTPVEGEDDDIEGDQLMSEQEFKAAFKHRPRQDAQNRATDAGPVIGSDKDDDPKYEILRDPEITSAFKQNFIQIQNTIKYSKRVNVYRAKIGEGMVAIKVIDMKDMEDDLCKLHRNDLELRKRLQEGRHPGLIKTFEIREFPAKSKYLLILEFASRGTLYDIIHQNGPMDEKVAAKMFYHLYKALRYLHFKKTIAHRNITLDNILVTGRGHPKLTDFKYAVQCVHRSQEINTAVGKAEFLAPEILRVRENKPYVPFPADCWSLGVCFFMMLNDGKPFRGGNLDALYNEQLQRNLQWRDLVMEDISADVKKLIEGILEPNISARLDLHRLKREPYVVAIEKAIRDQKTADKLARFEQAQPKSA